MKFPHSMLDLKDPLFAEGKDTLELAAELILRNVGEDPTREGVERTPARFAKAMREITSGYGLSAEDAVGEGVFPSEGPGLVSIRDIEFQSTCEHHLLPFFGKVNVAYYPHKKIVGLSKVPRLVNLFARRLQVQERLTREIGDSLHRLVEARAVAVKATACHMCMMMRGVRKVGSETTTEFFVGLDGLSKLEQERLTRAVD